ncbi:thiamine pyrophosphate-binding protein [Edaphosphingomonas haloaromaticamans]|uniref:Acetolactate synthase isozyme 3 large subunit n=1 Tax=Edaphosphingomonas haloaromaticamans TaxID=653954 RepID=A0A1S1H8S7_9SPHN|nr:thiamine pyrophosphate-binding protein [Sphingomonas haloaromaticamans]OHT18212.1 Acetolactate synthase isozyme 3 large subunit [Sphingomonas haloaromaticamans]
MTTMKLSDWVAGELVRHGIGHVFMLTGGGAMHLNHSLGTHAGLQCTFTHHEQALAMAAEAYYRLTNRLAVVNVTSGPGGTNAITGVYGAFVDSVGMLVISGQVKTETTVRSTGLPLRQYGDQELDIEEIVRPITKYATMVTDPRSIRYHLEKAIYLATSGRPGPCWLDIPLDVQAARIDPDDLLPGFDPAELDEPWKRTDLDAAAAAILERLQAAERPVVFAGGGVRLSGAHGDFIRLIEKLGVPVVTGWNAHDVLWNDHPLYAGRPGTVGDRAGNMVTQSADFLLVLGSRLNIRQVSYNWKTFARAAYKVWVDIDPVELRKPTVTPDMPVVADLADLIPAMLAAPYAGPTDAHRLWLGWARNRGPRFPTVLPEYRDNALVHPYVAMDELFAALDEDDIVVTGNGSACVVSFQVAALKRGQRLWTNSGCATMGYDLPAAIGVCAATGSRQRVICLAGDGSIMMNLQEMQTIAGYGLPVKVFLLNNSGYVSIFQTHRNFFNGVEVGGGPKSNVTFPDFGKVAHAFGFAYFRAASHDDLAATIADALAADGPVLCEIMLDEHVSFAPKLGAKQHPDGRITSPALEDLSPFLPREVLRENMLIDLIEEA